MGWVVVLRWSADVLLYVRDATGDATAWISSCAGDDAAW